VASEASQRGHVGSFEPWLEEWIVDADLKDFFGSVDHEKLLTVVAQQIAAGRVLRLIEAMLKAGAMRKGGSFQQSAGLLKAG
jgi:RNA-directed DNA polymerase